MRLHDNLKIHSNPFLVDRDMRYQRKYNDSIGRNPELSELLEEVKGFIADPKECRSFFITGESGTGKTLLARSLIHEIKKEGITSDSF